MKTNMYVLFDSASKLYSKPMFLHNDAMAIRVATDMLNNPSDVSRHPEQFSIFFIGTYDDITAETSMADVYLVTKLSVLKNSLAQIDAATDALPGDTLDKSGTTILRKVSPLGGNPA